MIRIFFLNPIWNHRFVYSITLIAIVFFYCWWNLFATMITKACLNFLNKKFINVWFITIWVADNISRDITSKVIVGNVCEFWFTTEKEGGRNITLSMLTPIYCISILCTMRFSLSISLTYSTTSTHFQNRNNSSIFSLFSS